MYLELKYFLTMSILAWQWQHSTLIIGWLWLSAHYSLSFAFRFRWCSSFDWPLPTSYSTTFELACPLTFFQSLHRPRLADAESKQKQEWQVEPDYSSYIHYHFNVKIKRSGPKINIQHMSQLKYLPSWVQYGTQTTLTTVKYNLQSQLNYKQI